MDTESLRALVAFAETGCNLTRAGEAIGLSQPAMHARLQGLARSFGVEVYERRGRRLVLTVEGDRVLGWARDVLERERALRAQLQGGPGEERVVVACGEGALVHVVADRLAGFARAHPGRLSFLVGDGPSSVAAVERGDAHLAVVAGSSQGDGGLRAQTLLTTSLVALAPRRHAAVRKGRLAVEDLFEHALLVPPRGRPLRALLDDAAASRGRSLEVAAEVTGWEAVARLAALGVGVGVVNDVVKTPGLARAELPGLPGTTYRVLARRGRPLPAVGAAWEALAAASSGPVLVGR